MEMTMLNPASQAADFTNCPKDDDWNTADAGMVILYLPISGANSFTAGSRNPIYTAIAGTVSVCLLIPGAIQFQQRGPSLAFSETNRIQTLPAILSKETIIAPVGQLITAIREGWHLNMTELASILGVTRPTLYNWLKDKNMPVSKVMVSRLQALAAAADVWNQNSDGGRHDFLLDYTGPQANEVCIRHAMSQPEVSADGLSALIEARSAQYSEARARTREILGEPMTLPAAAPPEASRRLHELWAKSTKALHSARNTNR